MFLFYILHLLFILVMAFQWLRKYQGQIILGSSVAGIWLGYTWYGEIFGLSSYIKKMGFYDEGASEVQEITPETLSLIDKVTVSC